MTQKGWHPHNGIPLFASHKGLPAQWVWDSHTPPKAAGRGGHHGQPFTIPSNDATHPSPQSNVCCTRRCNIRHVQSKVSFMHASRVAMPCLRFGGLQASEGFNDNDADASATQTQCINRPCPALPICHYAFKLQSKSAPQPCAWRRCRCLPRSRGRCRPRLPLRALSPWPSA